MNDTTYDQRTQDGVHAGEIDESVEFQEQIVTFADDSAVITETLVADKPQTFQEASTASDYRTHTIIDFLQRPQNIGTYNWTTTHKSGDTLFSLKFPKDLMTDMTKSKLDGFTSFSATVKLQIQVNAQPFQAGRLILATLPVPDILDANRRTWIDKSLSYVTPLPHVQLDISKQSEIILTIPYVSPFKQYDLVSGLATNWSEFIAKVYSPLSSPGTPTLPVTVWAHFENINLGFPTTRAIAQSGEQSGPLSGLATTATNVVGSVARAAKGLIPNINKYTDPLQQMGGGLSGLLKALGLSKPVNVLPATVVVVKPTPNFTNADGVDQSHPMSLMSDNAVALKPHFGGSSANEMLNDYVFKVPNYIRRFSFATTSTSMEVLDVFPVHPQYLNDMSNEGTDQIFSFPTTLAYTTGFYQYWRGSLVYTFKFVKTNFHSGRVQITFIPFAGTDEIADANKKLLRGEYAYKIVVDLREQTEVSFSVPFVSTTEWKLNRQLLWMNLGDSYTSEFEKGNIYGSHDTFFTGVIAVSAVTSLQASSTVAAQSIDCIVEVKAGEDFAVAVPIEPLWMPISDYVPYSQNVVKAVAQSGFASAGTQDIRSNFMEGKFVPQDITGNSRNVQVTQVPEQECIGEKVSSFSELLKRFSFRKTLAYGRFWFPIFDMALPKAKFTLEGTANQYINFRFADGNEHYSTLLTSIANMYAFYRGGIRFKFFLDKVDSNQPLCEVSMTGRRGINKFDYQKDTTGDMYSYPASYEQLNVKNVVEANFPYYSRVSTSVVNPNSFTAVTPDYIGRFASSASKVLIAHAAADDFELGFFLGAPLAVPNINSYLGNNPVPNYPTFITQ